MSKSLPFTATATVRYRAVGSSTWVVGHPLHRIQPDFANREMSLDHGFAWTIIGLIPGTSYEVEVTMTNATQVTVESVVMTTRALPGTAGAPTKFIAAGATTAQIQATLDSAVAGDVIQFSDGLYDNNSMIILRRSGSALQPIVIRGQSPLSF